MTTLWLITNLVVDIVICVLMGRGNIDHWMDLIQSENSYPSDLYIFGDFLGFLLAQISAFISAD
ncbi:hypothetical protein SLEP1_g4012 [Rubroshorea leprosula]|uniref:Uncharacterized protein n=1 Tax=Rubroshorea leprosula TaxID=152421 RepID=A0AAV5HVH0_9ROSI|nr:hypothetical protein SLEP1_g4012 [Rubroshorea leprosula]